MSYLMQPYDDALEQIMREGAEKKNKRTGTRTKAVLGLQTRYRLDTEHFPVMTRRKYWPRAVFAELLWFLSGSTNNEDLKKLGCNFWTPWVSEEFENKHGFAPGSFGPVYGFQLRHFGGYYGNGIGGDVVPPPSVGRHEEMRRLATTDQGKVYGLGGFDQLQYLMNRIQEDPSDRRLMFSLWNPKELNRMRLPPCHFCYQVFIDDEGRLSGMLTQRSCDFPIGIPANIQFYSALTCMIAQQTGYKAHEFIHSAGDAHVYAEQFDAVEEYLSLPVIDSPQLVLNKAANITSYTIDDFRLEGFACGPKVEIPVAV